MPSEHAARLPVPHAQPREVRDIRAAVFPDDGGDLDAVRPIGDVPSQVSVAPREHQLFTRKAGGSEDKQLRSSHLKG